MTKRVLILGSTGSIGEQALEVIVALRRARRSSASSAGSELGAACSSRRASTACPRVALADPAAAEQADAGLERRACSPGEEGVRELIADSGADLVLNAIVGSAGLGPTIVALTEGIDLALANKESLVVGGELVTALAEATGARIIPVDSEHSALLPADPRRAARAPSTGSS